MAQFKTLISRPIAIAFAVLVSGMLILALESPEHEKWNSPGSQRDMHEKHACELCHQPAVGTIRQQVQANLKYWLGFREHGADFVTVPIQSSDCLDCHRNEDDPHAGHLFLEPRYAETRDLIKPQDCSGCHSHHSGKVSVRGGNFCFHCHQDLSITGDQTVPTHKELVADEQWQSCLQCHDYHGNHDGEVPLNLEQASSLEKIRNYLEGYATDSPHGDLKTPYLEERNLPR